MSETQTLTAVELDVDLNTVVPCQFQETWGECTREATLRGRKDCCPALYLACRSCAAVMTVLLTEWWQETYGTTAPCDCGGRTTTVTWWAL